MATNTFQIVITQTGAQQTAQAISQVGAAAQKSANIMGLFRQALVLASTVRAASGLVELADAATNINNRLRVATSSAQEFARAQQFVYDISMKTGTLVEANAQVYGRLIQSTKGLGFSTADLEKSMTSLTLAVRIGGATSQEARNAMIQFSQGLASGALRGDELRSVAEQLPMLAQIIGEKFGVSGGQLIAFSKAAGGTALNSKLIIEALTGALPKLEDTASKMSMTLGQGFENVHTALIKLFGDLNSSTGIFATFGQGLTLIANNLRTVIALVTALIILRFRATLASWAEGAAAFARDLGAMFSLIRQGQGVMASFNALFMLNPLTLWIAAIAAAGVALVALYEHFPVVKDAVDTLFGALGTIVEAFNNIYQAIVSALPSWASFDNVMQIVAVTVAGLTKALAALITLAFIPIATVIAGVVSALHAFGVVNDETAKKVGDATASLYNYYYELVNGKAATVDAGAATEKLADSTSKALSPLLNLTGGAKSAASAHKEFADEVKHLDENSARFASGKFVNDGSWMQASVDGFTNLARVTKDWEKYTTDAGTAVTTTKAATAAAKPPTDALAGSMGAVNKQASGAASATLTMASSLDSSAKSSATSVEQITLMTKGFETLNPLMKQAGEAGQAAANGFAAAGQAAAGAVSGIEQLAQAYRDLAAAKAAAGEGGSSSNTSSDNGGARASGGPVISGSTYLVGEKGPELFTPNSNGNIIPNHVLTASSGSGAANDNLVPLVKAINRMANAVQASNQITNTNMQSLVTEVQTQTEDTAKALRRAAVDVSQSQSFKGTGYQDPSGYMDWSGARMTYGFGQWPGWVGYGVGQDPRTGAQQFTTPEEYSRYMQANKILPGDEQYRGNGQMAYERYGFHAGGIVQWDSNTPYARDIASLQNQLALAQAAYERYKDVASGTDLEQMLGAIKSYQESIKQYTAKQDAAVEYLKGARDAEANFQQFKDAIPSMMAEASKTQDFQTLTPWEGGKQYGTSDPYGIGSAPRPDQQAVETNVGQKAASISNDNRVQVQMTVNTPSAESFRQNRAQVESAVASMVDRANRRAGRT